LLNGTRAEPEVRLVPAALRLTSGLRLRFASSNLLVRASLRLARPNKFANPSPVIGNNASASNHTLISNPIVTSNRKRC